MQVNQIELISAIAKHLEKKHGKASVSVRQMNAVIEAATLIVDAFAREDVPAIPGMGLAKWMKSDDTGLSSRFMAAVLSGIQMVPEKHHPHDPSDFGRCYRLLEAVPELRGKMDRMKETSQQWKALVENWAELESLYVEEFHTGNAPKLYARMQELLHTKS